MQVRSKLVLAAVIAWIARCMLVSHGQGWFAVSVRRGHADRSMTELDGPSRYQFHGLNSVMSIARRPWALTSLCGHDMIRYWRCLGSGGRGHAYCMSGGTEGRQSTYLTTWEHSTRAIRHRRIALRASQGGQQGAALARSLVAQSVGAHTASSGEWTAGPSHCLEKMQGSIDGAYRHGMV
jgi:hypothetical protein